MTRNAALLLFAFALAASAPPVRAAEAAAPAPLVLRAVSDTADVDANGQWALRIEVTNNGSFGAYLDSVMVTSTPLAGPDAGKASRMRLPFAGSLPPVGTGETQGTNLSLASSRYTTRLVLEISAHTRETAGIVLPVTLIGPGHDLAALHPPVRVRIAGRTLELTRIEAGTANAGSGVLLLPDEGSDGYAALEQGIQLANMGFASVIAMPPGAGGSQGPADLAGPASLALARAALDSLAHTPGVDPARLAVWGAGTGGTLALLLAAQRPEVVAVVAQGAIVDPWATSRALAGDARAAFVREAGKDSASWRARSPFAGAKGLRAAVLIVHGEKDEIAPAAGVRELAAVLTAQGAKVEAKFEPTAGHSVPANLARRYALRFLRANTSPAR